MIDDCIRLLWGQRRFADGGLVWFGAFNRLGQTSCLRADLSEAAPWASQLPFLVNEQHSAEISWAVPRERVVATRVVGTRKVYSVEIVAQGMIRWQGGEPLSGHRYDSCRNESESQGAARKKGKPAEPLAPPYFTVDAFKVRSAIHCCVKYFLMQSNVQTMP